MEEETEAVKIPSSGNESAKEEQNIKSAAERSKISGTVRIPLFWQEGRFIKKFGPKSENTEHAGFAVFCTAVQMVLSFAAARRLPAVLPVSVPLKQEAGK